MTPYYVLFYTALYTGLRRGELLGLRWADLDLDLASLSVVQTLQRVGGVSVMKGTEEPAQPAPGVPAPLPGPAAAPTPDPTGGPGGPAGEAPGGGRPGVFHPNGTPLEPSTISHEFAALLRRTGLPHIRFHDLRHTHVTLMLKARVHPRIVSERLGHATVALTLDTYSHVVPGLQEAAPRRFDGLLEPRAGAEGQGDVSKALAEASRTDRDEPDLEAVATSFPRRGGKGVRLLSGLNLPVLGSL